MQKNIITILILILCISAYFKTYAEEPQTTRLMASYIKQADGTKRIKATLLAIAEKGKTPVESASLRISTLDGETAVLLGTVVTNYKGLAYFDIPKTAHLPLGADGNYNFRIQFDSNKQYAESQAEVSVKDVHIELIIDEQDTGKNIKAFVYEMDDKGAKKTIPGVDVEFDIKRLFGNYGFATVKTDSSGTSYTVFPTKMPGDSVGNVTILARLVDNETYATVESSKKVKWGVPVIPSEHHKRGLGDTDAPLWMVYTLIVLLSGVWLHFSYIIFSILRINYLGRKMLKESSSPA